MTSIAQLEVELDLDNGRFTGKLNSSGQALRVFERQIDSNSGSVKRLEHNIRGTTDALDTMRRASLAFVGFEGIKAGISSLIDAQKAMQQIQFGLVGALGSTRAAGEAFAFVRDKSKELGLNLQVASTEFTKITAAATAMGVPMQEQKKLFDGLARAMTVMHLSADQVKFSSMAIGQMFSKGKIQAEELRRQLGEQIPGVVPRFQRAVMEMTKGTDLQGMSFDKLLQKGLITTDKFLPALVKALEESGHGAEEAAKGLQAGLNQLATSWFEFKDDVSGGLFNDSVNAGARLLAANLHQVAAAATIAGAAIISRFAGGGLQKLYEYNAMTRALAEAHQMDAKFTLEGAKASRVAAMAESSEVARRLENIKTLQAENAVRLEGQRLKRADAIEQAKGSFGTRMAYLKRTGELPAVAEANSRRVITGLLQDQQRNIARATALELELAAATAAEAEAKAAVAVASQRVAASSGLAALGSQLKSAASGLLALVGGPWGAAVLAASALGYAIYSAYKRSEEAKEKFEQQAKSLREMRTSIDDVINAYKGLRGDDVNIGEIVTQWNEANVATRQAQKDIDALTLKIENYKARLDAMRTSSREGVGSNFGQVAEDMALAQEELKKLQAETGPTKAKFLQLQDLMRESLKPEIFDKLLEAAKKLNDADFKKLYASLDETAKRGLAAAEAIRSINSSLEDKLWTMQIGNVKKLKGEYAALRLEVGHDLLEKAGGSLANVPQAELARTGRLLKSMREQIDLGKRLSESKKTTAKAAKEQSAAEKELNNSYDNLINSIKQQTQTNEDALLSDDKLTASEKLHAKVTLFLKENKDKLTASMVAELQALDASNVKLGDQLKLKQMLAKAEIDLAQLKEEHANSLQTSRDSNEADLMGIGHSSEAVERMRRMIAISKEYNREIQKLNKTDIEKTDPVSYQNQLAEIQDFYSKRLAIERDFQSQRAAMEADWRNGFRSAMEEYAATGANTAALVKQATTNSFDAMTNSFLEFCNTGKTSFKGLMVFVLKEIQRVLMAKAIAALANMVLSMFGGGGMSMGSGAGSMTSFGNNASGMMTNMGGYIASANGNVVTPMGAMPLNKYAGGGIARTPQVSIFGEGRLPEAYVPLPDGRSIPVTVSGAMEGSQSVQSNVQIAVTVNNDGSSQTETKSSDAKEGRMLGELIGSRVKQIMAEEMRQGGLLWKMSNK